MPAALALLAALGLGLPATRLAQARPAQLPSEGGLSPEEAALPWLTGEKRALAEQASQRRAAQLAVPAAAKTPPRTPTPDVRRQPEPPRGILNQDLSPPPTARDVRLGNAWQDQVDGAWIQVYAGALAADPEQGIVLVLPEAGAGSRYLTPAKTGTVRVVASSGARLALQAASGAAFVFDLSARAFVPTSR